MTTIPLSTIPFTFRCPKTTSLDHCPRCQSGCEKCDGANASYCVPRSYSNEYKRGPNGWRYADQGWWCQCCFQQVFDKCNRATQDWLREVASVANSWWLNTDYEQKDMAALTKEVTKAAKSLKLGRAWVSPNECDQTMKFVEGGDWLMAGIDPDYGPNDRNKKVYALTKELAALIPPR